MGVDLLFQGEGEAFNVSTADSLSVISRRGETGGRLVGLGGWEVDG